MVSIFGLFIEFYVQNYSYKAYGDDDMFACEMDGTAKVNFPKLSARR
jgi:hypothetical protein